MTTQTLPSTNADSETIDYPLNTSTSFQIKTPTFPLLLLPPIPPVNTPTSPSLLSSLASPVDPLLHHPVKNS